MTKAEEVKNLIFKQAEEEGITVAELARRAKYPERAMRYWHQGRQYPSLNSADTVLKNLGLSVTIGVDKNE